MSLVELELQLETPLFAGGHDPLKLDELWFLRPSEVKGVWRWWARALVAGALYDAGQLKGVSRHGIVKAPTPAEANKISEIVGINMGLGYADPRGRLSRASCYSLVVEPIDANRFKKTYRGGPVALRGGQANLQRATLLALGRRSLEYLTPGARFRLRVEEQLPTSREATEAALAALSLALTFSCFGKGGRRGLGCFRVVRASGGYAGFFDARVAVAERVNRAVNAIRKLLGVKAVEGGEGELPPLPSISAKKLTGGYAVRGHDLRPFQVAEVRGDDVRRLLEELHNFFLRSVRAGRLFGNPAAQDALRQWLGAWVLGLPREQRGTGYRIKAADVDRRASPLLLAVHEAAGERQTRREGVAYLSVFASADWPAQLDWRGGGGSAGQTIAISDRTVANALVLALDEFMDYVARCRFSVSFVWP